MAFVICSWTPLFSRPPPLVLPPPVLLFRIELVHGFVRLCVGFDRERRPILLVPSGLLNQSNPIPLVLFVMDFRFGFDALDCDGS